MARQVLVIGLGQFGMSLARALALQQIEVMVVDTDPEHVQEIAPYVSDALLLDATNEEALTALAPSRRDSCICTIGDENREASIIVTALLRQLGAKHVIARATDTLHARILSMVGAHEVVRPEQDFGQRLAVRLAWRGVLNYAPLGEELVLTEVMVPPSLIGRTLAELTLPSRYGIIVAAVKHVGGKATIPQPTRPLVEGDKLTLVGNEDKTRQFIASQQ